MIFKHIKTVNEMVLTIFPRAKDPQQTTKVLKTTMGVTEDKLPSPLLSISISLTSNGLCTASPSSMSMLYFCSAYDLPPFNGSFNSISTKVSKNKSIKQV